MAKMDKDDEKHSSPRHQACAAEFEELWKQATAKQEDAGRDLRPGIDAKRAKKAIKSLAIASLLKRQKRVKKRPAAAAVPSRRRSPQLQDS